MDWVDRLLNVWLDWINRLMSAWHRWLTDDRVWAFEMAFWYLLVPALMLAGLVLLGVVIWRAVG